MTTGLIFLISVTLFFVYYFTKSKLVDKFNSKIRQDQAQLQNRKSHLPKISSLKTESQASEILSTNVVSQASEIPSKKIRHNSLKLSQSLLDIPADLQTVILSFMKIRTGSRYINVVKGHAIKSDLQVQDDFQKLKAKKEKETKALDAAQEVLFSRTAICSELKGVFDKAISKKVIMEL